jgi:7-keto-8-aminopelargonate synthetase-like enzyme
MCVNLASYNYLGFADDWHTTCRADVMRTSASMPISMCTSFAEGGYTALHAKLEATVANFLDKEAAVRSVAVVAGR